MTCENIGKKMSYSVNSLFIGAERPLARVGSRDFQPKNNNNNNFLFLNLNFIFIFIIFFATSSPENPSRERPLVGVGGWDFSQKIK